MQTKHHKMHCT